MNFPASTIALLCKKYGPQVQLPAGTDGTALMSAIASNESDFGANIEPRHEPAYDTGGSFWRSSSAVRALVGAYPSVRVLGDWQKPGTSAAAYSYGPWQVMAVNANGIAPEALLSDPEACARAYVHFMETYILGATHARTVAQILQAYNSGNFRPTANPGILAYVADGLKHYSALVGVSA